MARTTMVLLAALAMGCSGSQDETDPPVQTDTDAGGTETGDAATGHTGAPDDTGTTSSPCDAVHGNHTVGLLMCDPRASEGYTLFAPNSSTTTYLVDNHGRLVHSWSSSYRPGHSVYLLDDGRLLRAAQDNQGTPFSAGGAGGRVEILEWDGTVAWSYAYRSTQVLQHHDVEWLPSGNVLIIGWELKTSAEAVAAGRDPMLVTTSGVWVDHVIEVDPDTDAIVWEWHLWDHLVQDHDPTQANYGVVADHPELVDLNLVQTSGPLGQPSPDWNHVNGIDYNAALDQIVLSSHNQNEVWIIDHSTTTAEAASHTGGASGRGGDLLYRWGNPQTYDAGTGSDKQLSGQHDAEWIPDGYPGAGNLTIFNNGVGSGSSSAIEIETPVQVDGSYPRTGAWGPAAPVWSYSEGSSFYAQNISGTQRLPNGNTLICNGPSGHFFEVTTDGDIVWSYLNPVTQNGPVPQGTNLQLQSQNSVFRADRYAPDHPGLAGRDLTPKGTIEQ